MLAARDPLVAAVALFWEAAMAGSTAAMHNLGVAHHKGAGGLERDDESALEWLERSGGADSLRMMSAIHRANGRSALARLWLERSARAGDQLAQQQLQATAREL